MSNYSHILAVEGRSSHEGVGILEKGFFHVEYELLDASMSFANTNRERVHPEEVVVISGSIKISP